MNKQEGIHCERCHTVIIGNVYTWSKDYPVVSYEEPKRCPVCKSTNYKKEDLQESYLPTSENGILCRCQHPRCEKEFYNRESWYKIQQEIVKAQNNPWMPILIEEDKDRGHSNLSPETASVK